MAARAGRGCAARWMLLDATPSVRQFWPKALIQGRYSAKRSRCSEAELGGRAQRQDKRLYWMPSTTHGMRKGGQQHKIGGQFCSLACVEVENRWPLRLT